MLLLANGVEPAETEVWELDRLDHERFPEEVLAGFRGVIAFDSGGKATLSSG